MRAAASTRTVVYERWYLDEIEAAERRKRPPRPAPPKPPHVDKREPDPRRALAIAAERRGTTLADLSRMIERPAGYLARYVRDGLPRALKAEEHQLLAQFFGVDERGLGVRSLWVPM